jgi:hypothetical protein
VEVAEEEEEEEENDDDLETSSLPSSDLSAYSALHCFARGTKLESDVCICRLRTSLVQSLLPWQKWLAAVCVSPPYPK